VSRFHDDINRVFDQLLGDPWRRKPALIVQPDRSSTDSIWEVIIPIANSHPDEIAIAIHGRRVTVDLAAATRQSTAAEGSKLTTDRYEERRESFALPEGTTVESFEAKFEEQHLRLRIRLRPR